MRTVLIIIFLTFLAFTSGWYFHELLIDNNNSVVEVDKIKKTEDKVLEKYSIENLEQTHIPQGKINVGDVMDEEDNFTSYIFTMQFNPEIEGNLQKTTTGMINVPNNEGKYPIIVMFRGYVDQTIYTTGTGTKNAGKYFADNGFITIAPDFLGYAQSDIEAGDIFESRFQTYVTALTLLNSLDQINKWDGKNIFIWGHSNGGQIAITALEASTSNIPATLWAPVTKSFPYSILYYTDDSTDRGKFIRSELAKFETLYDVEKYSLDNYVGNIKSKVQIHQGEADDAIPIEWTDEFVNLLEDEEVDVIYHKYPSTDHNLRPSWDVVVARDLEFFKENLQ